MAKNSAVAERKPDDSRPIEDPPETDAQFAAIVREFDTTPHDSTEPTAAGEAATTSDNTSPLNAMQKVMARARQVAAGGMLSPSSEPGRLREALNRITASRIGKVAITGLFVLAEGAQAYLAYKSGGTTPSPSGFSRQLAQLLHPRHPSGVAGAVQDALSSHHPESGAAQTVGEAVVARGSNGNVDVPFVPTGGAHGAESTVAGIHVVSRGENPWQIVHDQAASQGLRLDNQTTAYLDRILYASNRTGAMTHGPGLILPGQHLDMKIVNATIAQLKSIQEHHTAGVITIPGHGTITVTSDQHGNLTYGRLHHGSTGQHHHGGSQSPHGHGGKQPGSAKQPGHSGSGGNNGSNPGSDPSGKPNPGSSPPPDTHKTTKPGSHPGSSSSPPPAHPGGAPSGHHEPGESDFWTQDNGKPFNYATYIAAGMVSAAGVSTAGVALRKKYNAYKQRGRDAARDTKIDYLLDRLQDKDPGFFGDVEALFGKLGMVVPTEDLLRDDLERIWLLNDDNEPHFYLGRLQKSGGNSFRNIYTMDGESRVGRLVVAGPADGKLTFDDHSPDDWRAILTKLPLGR